MDNIVKKLIDQAKQWTGYLEKKSNAQLDHFTANAGSSNYTCFARDYKVHTGLNLQAQPWCAMYVSEVFVQSFGVNTACKLLGGALYHYCPTGVNQFKKAGRWSTQPEPGAVIFFTNGVRAYHTGIVTEVVKKENKSGWQQEEGGWRFYLGDTGQPVRNDWYQDGEKWYWFDGAGMMVKNVWYEYKDHWYYLGSDGAMRKGQITVDGKWYVLDNEGRMITEPVTLTPDKNGALEWPGLINM